MSKFKSKRKRLSGEFSTSSMSDIIFMFLFFFMVTTTLRDTEMKVVVRLPEATEIAKLERKDLTSYINVGSPTTAYQGKFGTDTRLQLNDSYKTIDDIRDFIASERELMNEADRPFMTVALKIDETTRMGIVTDVKQELRRSNALKINYLARKAQ
jgi:biopolymer transport protein ExbD